MWAIVDVIYVVMFIDQKLYPTAVLYASSFFFVLKGSSIGTAPHARLPHRSECTGKTTLAEELAAHFNAPWVRSSRASS